MSQNRTARSALLGILFLFLLQGLSDFIKSIYAFGLLVTAFTIQVAAVALLFTPLLLLFFRRPPSRRVLIGMILAALLARLVEPNLALGGRLVAAGISVGAFLLVFPALLAGAPRLGGRSAAAGLAAAVMGSVLFRALGSGLDLTQQGAFQILGALLAAAAGILAWRVVPVVTPDPAAGAPSTGRVFGLGIGIAFVFLLVFFAFGSPAVIARWTGFSYALILGVLGAAWALAAAFLAWPRSVRLLSRGLVWGWNLLFGLALVLTILPHQIRLPPQPAAYPLEAQPAPAWALAPLVLMLLLSPVLMLDLLLFVRQLGAERPSIRQLGGAFGLAALLFLAMVFFQVFTTIYDYAPVIGPLFRDRSWLVYLLGGLGLALPLAAVRKESLEPTGLQVPGGFAAPAAGALAALAVAAALLSPRPKADPPPSDRLTVMTYNIQQGFDAAGNEDLDGQLAVIRRVDPDLLGLQESDTARLSSGNADVVRYFADRLGMYAYYGPTTTTGTFGIALLSRYQIEDARTFFMYSAGEQTATIQARLRIGGRTYNVFVTHLGNGGPMVQMQAILARVEGLDNVIAVGDYNFRPDSDQYALVTQTLDDSWLLRWPGSTDIPGYSPGRRIDYIFVSPGTTVMASMYVVDPASDHPYLYAEITP